MKKALTLLVLIIILCGCSSLIVSIFVFDKFGVEVFDNKDARLQLEKDSCQELIALEKKKSVLETQLVFYVYMKSEDMDYDVEIIEQHRYEQKRGGSLTSTVSKAQQKCRS